WVRSPVCSSRAGCWGRALMRLTASRSVAVTSVFGGRLKPMWLSLIWTKRKSLVVAAAGCGSALPALSSTGLQPRMPPLTVQNRPVPAQAMHLRNPRRSMPSPAGSWGTRFSIGKSPLGQGSLDDDLAGHPGVEGAEILVGAGGREDVRKAVVGVEGAGVEG